jgi:hypothetical protein
MQRDCNLVAYNENKAVWSSGTQRRGEECYLENQSDGNIVLYGLIGGAIKKELWDSKTKGKGKLKLVLRDIGDFAAFNGEALVWDNFNLLNVGPVTPEVEPETPEVEPETPEVEPEAPPVTPPATPVTPPATPVTPPATPDIVVKTPVVEAPVVQTPTVKVIKPNDTMEQIMAYESTTGSLTFGTILYQKEVLQSPDKKFKVVMQDDCNLVAYKDGVKTWSSDTMNKGKNCYLENKDDGNIVLYDEDEKLLWQTDTVGSGKLSLVAENTGNLSAYNGSNTLVWNNVDLKDVDKGKLKLYIGIGVAVLLVLIILGAVILR